MLNNAESMKDTFKQEMGNVQADLERVNHAGCFATSKDNQQLHTYEQQLQLYEEPFQALQRASSYSVIQRSDIANKLKAMGQRMAEIQAQSDKRYAN